MLFMSLMDSMTSKNFFPGFFGYVACIRRVHGYNVVDAFVLQVAHLLGGDEQNKLLLIKRSNQA